MVGVDGELEVEDLALELEGLEVVGGDGRHHCGGTMAGRGCRPAGHIK